MAKSSLKLCEEDFNSRWAGQTMVMMAVSLLIIRVAQWSGCSQIGLWRSHFRHYYLRHPEQVTLETRALMCNITT